MLNESREQLKEPPFSFCSIIIITQLFTVTIRGANFGVSKNNAQNESRCELIGTLKFLHLKLFLLRISIIFIQIRFKYLMA